MYTRISDASNKGARTIRHGLIHGMALTAILVVGFSPGQTARADSRSASASITFHASCTDQGCEQASGEVNFAAQCDGTDCDVDPDWSFQNPCQPETVIPESLVLHNVNDGECAASSDGESPFPVDLLAGQFVVSEAQFSQMLAGTYKVKVSLGVITAGGTATGTGSTTKSNTPVPSTSEWGLVVATVILLAAGTVVIRRRRFWFA